MWKINCQFGQPSCTKNAIYLSLQTKNDQYLICQECLKNQNAVDYNKLVSISEVLKDNQTFIQNWPPVDQNNQSLTHQIQELISFNKQLSHIIEQQIKTFYKQTLVDITVKIMENEKNQIDKFINQRKSIEEQLLINYQLYSEIPTLKTLLSGGNQSELRNFIKRKQDQDTSEFIINLINEHTINLNQLDTQFLNKKKKEIIDLIGELQQQISLNELNKFQIKNEYQNDKFSQIQQPRSGEQINQEINQQIPYFSFQDSLNQKKINSQNQDIVDFTLSLEQSLIYAQNEQKQKSLEESNYELIQDKLLDEYYHKNFELLDSKKIIPLKRAFTFQNQHMDDIHFDETTEEEENIKLINDESLQIIKKFQNERGGENLSNQEIESYYKKFMLARSDEIIPFMHFITTENFYGHQITQSSNQILIQQTNQHLQWSYSLSSFDKNGIYFITGSIRFMFAQDSGLIYIGLVEMNSVKDQINKQPTKITPIDLIQLKQQFQTGQFLENIPEDNFEFNIICSVSNNMFVITDKELKPLSNQDSPKQELKINSKYQFIIGTHFKSNDAQQSVKISSIRKLKSWI